LREREEKNKPEGINKWSSLFNSIIDHHELIELELKTYCIHSLIIEVTQLLKNWTCFLLVLDGTLLTIMSVLGV
jgi:hypothetical protein